MNYLRRANIIKLNVDNPPVKDTLALPHGGFAILRFLAKNPGIWLFHCHIDIHSELGMTLVFKVGNQNQFPLLPKQFPTCFIPQEPASSQTMPSTTIKSKSKITGKKFILSSETFWFRCSKYKFETLYDYSTF